MTELEKSCRTLANIYNRLNATAAAAEREVKDTAENKQYSDKYRGELLRKATAKRDNVVRDAMDEMQEAVDREVEKIRSAHKIDLQNNAAHQIAVSNALKMVELAGENLTAEQLQGLASTFITAGDRQTLDMLETICLNRCPEAFHTAFGAGIEDDAKKVQLFGVRLVRGIGVSERSMISIELARQFLSNLGFSDIKLTD